MKYLPIKDAPIDECVILATSGGWVGEAIYGEDAEQPAWRWIHSQEPLHPNLTPLGWTPLPAAIDSPV